MSTKLPTPGQQITDGKNWGEIINSILTNITTAKQGAGSVTGIPGLYSGITTANSLTEGAIKLNGTSGSIIMDDGGHKRISWSDGGGESLNLKSGNYIKNTVINGTNNYTSVYAKSPTGANSGASVIAMSGSGDGRIELSVAPIGDPDTAVTWANSLILNKDSLITTKLGSFTGIGLDKIASSSVTDNTFAKHALELKAPDGKSVHIAFHKPGKFAAYFGLDADNQFAMGGWSSGDGYTGLKVGAITSSSLVGTGSRMVVADATGKMTAVALPSTAGDNLGNHTATMALNMNNQDIAGIKDLNIKGKINSIGGITPTNGAIRLTSNLHLNSGDGTPANVNNGVYVNWDNGTPTNKAQNSFVAGNGAGVSNFVVSYAGDASVARDFGITRNLIVNGAITGPTITDLYNKVAAAGGASTVVGDHLGNHTATMALNMNGQVINNVGSIFTPAGAYIKSQGRLHIAGEEVLYLLNKGGVTIGKEDGGSGELRVQGRLYVTNTGTGNYESVFMTNGTTNIALESNKSNNAGFQIATNTGEAVYISFHKIGKFAVNFGLDADNQFAFGGWSSGNDYTGIKAGYVTSSMLKAPAGAWNIVAANENGTLVNTSIPLSVTPGTGNYRHLGTWDKLDGGILVYRSYTADNAGVANSLTQAAIDQVKAAIPASTGADNLGNHTATTDLNMNEKSINNVIFIQNTGRLHIGGGELLYLLNKDGVIVGKEQGGNGNLRAQGYLTSDALGGEGNRMTLTNPSGTIIPTPVSYTPAASAAHWDGDYPYVHLGDWGPGNNIAGKTPVLVHRAAVADQANSLTQAAIDQVKAAIPASTGADNLGNHTATTDLNMNEKSINNVIFIQNTGRLHIGGGELLYLLNKDGVIVGKEQGGNGNLRAQGYLTSDALGGGLNDKILVATTAGKITPTDTSVASLVNGVTTAGNVANTAKSTADQAYQRSGDSWNRANEANTTANNATNRLNTMDQFFNFAAGPNGGNADCKLALRTQNRRSIYSDGGIAAKGDLSCGGNLTVSGAASKPGGGSFNTTSDIKTKDVRGKYERGLEDISKIEIIKYNYKADNFYKFDSKIEYVGVVAQELQKSFPEAVSTDENDLLRVDMQPVQMAMINAIKELKAQIDALKAEVASLKK